MSAATRVAHAAETIRARWERGVVESPQTEAAQALEDTCQLLDPEVAAELERLRARVADLEAGLPAMQEALLRALDRVAELEAERHSTNEALSEAAEQLRVDRDGIAELEAAPVTVFRAEHPDSGITLGHYGTEAAARAHCETTERRSWGPGHTLVFDWIEDDEDRIAELVVTAGQNEESTTGYIVTALEIPSAYDPDADE
ncbi:hypothetical protein F3K20_12680 [Streptomyces scabiei]|uniref:hypothetical protein n=1 Tax=Streptomyces scabiei TaxID=1930 RepID=UPI001B30E16E|nr:hypothetical protein [Streptomyces sp. LBUM 1482]QTU45604.1 hypothetical protein F3K20_12680 [Streptomyces sp. LBUM 1482]